MFAIETYSWQHQGLGTDEYKDISKILNNFFPLKFGCILILPFLLDFYMECNLVNRNKLDKNV